MPADIENEVKSLTTWLHSFEYIVLASIWYKVLTAINGVSCLLQRSSLTLDEQSAALIDDLQKIRNSWSSLLQESKLVAANFNCSQNFKSKRRRKTKVFYDEEGSTAHDHENEEVAFKVKVFYVALDQRSRGDQRKSEKLAICFHSSGL